MAKAELVTQNPHASTWQAIKAALRMRFPGLGGGGSALSGGYAWRIDDDFTRNIIRSAARFAGTTVDFAQEAGEPELSSLVMAYVNWLGRSLTEAPLVVMAMDKGGKETPNHMHPALKVLRRPNPFYPGSTLLQALATSWGIKGNGYWLKARNGRMDKGRDGRGQVIQLWHVPYWMMDARWPATTSDVFISYYEYLVDGQPQKIDPADVVHFRNGLADDLRNGVSPIESVYREIYKDNTEANYGALLARNGAVPPVVLSIKEAAHEASETDLKAYKENYQASTQGDERGKVFVSNYPIEITKLGLTPAEMDLSAAHFFNEQRFCAVVGVDVRVLGFGSAMQGSTFSNQADARKAAVENVLCPLWAYLEDELTHQLGPDLGLLDNERFAFDLTRVRVLREDKDALYKRVTNAYKVGGWMKRSEAREEAGLPITPEDDGYYDDLKPAPVPQPMVPGLNPKNPNQLEASAKSLRALPWLKSKYDFSSTRVDLPEDLAAMVKEMAALIPEADLHEKGREGNPHITIKYGLHTQVAADVEPILADAGPLRATLGVTDYFIGDEFDVVYVSVESADLRKLNRKISDALDHTDTQTGYTPHVTIAYVKSGKGEAYAGDAFLEGVDVVFDEVVFSHKPNKKARFTLIGNQKKSLKSFDLAGLKVARKPTTEEAAQMPGIAAAQDGARVALTTILATLRERLIDSALVQLAAGDLPPVLSLTKDENAALTIAITNAYDAGYMTTGQRVPPRKSLADAVARILKALRTALLARVIGRVVDEYARALLRDLTEVEAREQTAQVLADEPAAYVEELASGAGYEAVGSGRNEALVGLMGPGVRFQYSAILDKNTCDPCLAEDGKESDDPRKLSHAPLPTCSGRYRCRCQLVVLYV